MGNDVVVSARIERAIEREVVKTASEDSRTRSGQLEHLVKLGLAARNRVAELERLASAAATEAARAHLREHRRLAAIEESDHGT